MAATPENKVKQMVRGVLDEFSEDIQIGQFHVKTLYQFWPVPSGFGASSLDCIVCYYGLALYIETKAPKKRPTPRQDLTIAEIVGSGGMTMVIDSKEGCDLLRQWLNLVKAQHANYRVPETPDRGGAG